MRSLRYFLLTALALSLFSCAKQQSELLQVTSQLPTGVIARDQVITLTFSKGVVPVDSLNLWTGTPYIEFTPAVPGKFVWQDSTRLVFSPDAPFAGDTRYSAKINTALLQQMSGAKGFDGSAEFSFATPSFTLVQAEFFYDRLGENRQVGIKANLDFTYAVDPQEVAARIRLTVDDKPQPIARVVTVEKSRTIALELGAVSQTERPRNISISFDDQLVSVETNTRIRMEKPFGFVLPPLGHLEIYGHEAGFDGTQGWVRVTTSQEVDPAAVKNFVALNPSHEYTVQGAGESFTLRGKFEPGTVFHMVIKKGLESYLGGKLENDYEADILIGNIEPSFRFASSSGVYMVLGGQKALEIKTVNVPKLNIRVSQVFQNNLVFFLDGGRSYDYDYYDYNEDGEGRANYQRKFRYYLGNYGRQLSFDSVVVRGGGNQEASTMFDLSPYLNTGYKGFYLVEIANTRVPWRSTSKLVSVSNIGLIVKRSAGEVMVFATSLETNLPMKGALVSLLSFNNQTVGTQKTDGDGVARFTLTDDQLRDFPLKLITAELDDDFNFINLEDYRVETSRFDVAGKRDAQNEFDAMLYGPRNLYRPGENIVIAGLVRKLTHELPAQMPVRLRLVSPRGTQVNEWQIALDGEGSFETTYQTQATSITGDYRFELYTGNNLFLATYKVSLEDFVPDRLRVTLTPSRDTARPGEKIVYDLLALNFFGPPAAGRNFQFEGSFEIVPFQSKRFRDFRFYDDAAKNYSANPLVIDGKTNEAGKATVEFPLPGRDQLTSIGLLKAKGKVAVFDESGRPVYQISQTTVYPKEYYIGLQNHGAFYLTPNSPQQVKIVAVDMADRPIQGFRAKVDLVRFEWHSVLRQHAGTGTLRYVSERREILEKSEKITLGSEPYQYSYAAPRSGDYELRVSKDGDSGYNRFSFYSYSWGTTDVTSFEVDPEARVDIVLDKPLYTPGDKARVLFQTPFDGKLLVTVERNHVYSYQYLDAVKNAASMELDVSGDFLPNVYVSAVLFRKVKEMNIPLLAGHGFAPLMVEKKTNRLEVSITAPERIRPRTKQEVAVVVAGEKNAGVTIAAVDEGILQLKNYKTPDPYGYFYARKALQTETFDFFRDLLPEQIRARGSAGGSDADIAQRANPLGVTRFKPLAIWSGILKTDGNGRASVTLNIPEFSGELRLMAFAYKGDRFGSAERPMKVSDPVVITPSLPRFLSPGDSVVMPITAFNTTGKEVSLKFDIETSGGITAAVRSTKLDVGANQERFVTIGLKATNQIGKAVVRVKTQVLGETLESVTELPVRPTAPFAAEGSVGFVDAGNSVSVDVQDVLLPYGRKAYLTLSPFPVANLAAQLKALVGYPHGCLEQTVSKAFPQIYLRDLAAVLAPAALSSGSPTYFVNEAITKVAAMQAYDGAFMVWPGTNFYNNWTTVYATHFLLEAKKAGYAVPEVTLKAGLASLAQIARGKKTEDYSYYENNKVVVKRIADKSVVYALYVLAVAHAAEKPLMDFYRAESYLLTTDTRYLLAGAYAMSGDRRSFNEILPPEFAVESAQRTTGGSFDSPVRANALILNVLMDTDPGNPKIPRYMDYLSRQYSSNQWYSTQDDAFTLLAFGKAARMSTGAKAEATISVGGKEYNYRGGNQRIDMDPFGKKVTINMRGSGRAYYSLVTEGIRADGGVSLQDKGLQVRRDFFDRNGASFNLAAAKQNDLIIVRVTLNSSVDRLENVAVTDLLPAGFEIENPRLTEMTSYAFIKNPSVPEYMDIRDDRINFYTSFRGTRQQTFFYAVRVVTAGEFRYAPIVAEAMYSADLYYSANGRTTVRVTR